MKTTLITALLILLATLSSIQAESRLVCNLIPRKNESQRHIWLLWTQKGQKDYKYISIEGRAYDRIPDWARRIKAIIDSKAHKLTFVIPETTKEMEGVLWCSGIVNRGIKLTLKVATKPTKISLIPKAYDCSKANYTKIGHQDKASKELLIHGIVRAPIHCPQEQTQVIIEGIIYNITCQQKTYSYAANQEGICYHDEAREAIIEGIEEKVFIDRYGYIVRDPARVACSTTSVKQSLKEAIQLSIRKTHATAALAQAVIGTPHVDLSPIFNKKAVYNLILGAERCMCGKQFSGLLAYYMWYRKYAAPASLVITATYVTWTIILFTIAMCLRIPLAKACRLVFPSFRRFKELKNLREQKHQKSKQIRLQEDRALRNLPPQNDYETILLTNFSEIYKNIAVLNKKMAKLESKNKILLDKIHAHNYNRKYRSYLRGHEPKPLPLPPSLTSRNSFSMKKANPMMKPSRQASFRSNSLNDLSVENYAVPIPFLGSQPHNLGTIANMQQPNDQENTIKTIRRGQFV